VLVKFTPPARTPENVRQEGIVNADSHDSRIYYVLYSLVNKRISVMTDRSGDDTKKPDECKRLGFVHCPNMKETGGGMEGEIIQEEIITPEVKQKILIPFVGLALQGRDPDRDIKLSQLKMQGIGRLTPSYSRSGSGGFYLSAADTKLE
jgi:hypothetical protein